MSEFGSQSKPDEIYVPEKLKIAVLCPSFAESESVFKEYVDLGYEIDAFNPKPDQYSFDLIGIKKSSTRKQMQELIWSGKYDLFFNLCDGFPEEDYAGVEVIEFLKEACVPCICPTKIFYSISKREMKYLAYACIIPTPNYFFVYPDNLVKLSWTDQVRHEANRLKYPMLVKHHNGGGSIGLSVDSKVHNIDALLKEVEKTLTLFGGALVEEFVTGREFTVLLSENVANPERPIVYQPFECILPSPESFKDFNLKMVNYNSLQWAPVLDNKICSALEFYSAEMYKACGGSSFARCDFRMCMKTGQLNFLEINPQCGVCGKVNEMHAADYILEYKSKRPEFMRNLIKCAFSNWHKKNPLDNMNFLDFSEKFARTRAKIAKNTVLVDLTKFSHTLVNRTEIDHWPAVRKLFFMEKSIKVNETVYADFKGDLRHFDMMAFRRAERSDANAKVDETLRIVTLKNLDAGQYVIIEKNYNN